MDRPLVIKGGTLIDGAGRAPLERATILIERGRFKAIAGGNDVSAPDGADVIDVAGRTVLPGFIDGHGHLEDFQGERYLHLRITTCVTIEIFQDWPWPLEQRRGTRLGRIRGPRVFTSVRAIGGARTAPD